MRFRDDPHKTVLKEICRASSPNGARDAVLVEDDGRNAYLIIVEPGGQIYSRVRVATLMHCDSKKCLELRWHADTELDVIGHCGDIVYTDIIFEEEDRARLMIPATVGP